ncbi:class I SAM-dependent methyltransferase [bacterium]|nr:class I SAM-dependent methyltransferase [bacterium]
MNKSSIPDPEADLLAYNRAAWNAQVHADNQWTVAVSAAEIQRAREGDWSIVLTPHRSVPKEWFPDFSGDPCRVLCLAGSGGQQAPILAAAGASVTVFDLSEEQLKQDQLVAERDGLTIESVQGDMSDLSCFKDESFDLIVHPCSNSFVPNVLPVWQEAARVLCRGGQLLAGFTKPVFYVFDQKRIEEGELIVKHSIPYSDLTSISSVEKARYIADQEPLCFGHSLSDQIGGQLEAGLRVIGYYEDHWKAYPVGKYIGDMAATRAIKN